MWLRSRPHQIKSHPLVRQKKRVTKWCEGNTTIWTSRLCKTGSREQQAFSGARAEWPDWVPPDCLDLAFQRFCLLAKISWCAFFRSHEGARDDSWSTSSGQHVKRSTDSAGDSRTQAARDRRVTRRETKDRIVWLNRIHSGRWRRTCASSEDELPLFTSVLRSTLACAEFLHAALAHAASNLHGLVAGQTCLAWPTSRPALARLGYVCCQRSAICTVLRAEGFVYFSSRLRCWFVGYLWCDVSRHSSVDTFELCYLQCLICIWWLFNRGLMARMCRWIWMLSWCVIVASSLRLRHNSWNLNPRMLVARFFLVWTVSPLPTKSCSRGSRATLSWRPAHAGPCSRSFPSKPICV